MSTGKCASARPRTRTPKQKQRKHGICRVLASYSSVQGLAWSVVDKPSVPPLEKSDFPFLSKSHFQIIFLINGGTLCLFSFPVLGLCSISTRSSLMQSVTCMSHTYVNSHTCVVGLDDPSPWSHLCLSLPVLCLVWICVCYHLLQETSQGRAE